MMNLFDLKAVSIQKNCFKLSLESNSNCLCNEYLMFPNKKTCNTPITIKIGKHWTASYVNLD